MTEQIITILALLAAILAWISKIWWTREQIASKNEIISSKEAQIELVERNLAIYKELTSEKLLNFFKAQRAALEDQINYLESELDQKHSELSEAEDRARTAEETLEHSRRHKDLLDADRVLETFKDNLHHWLASHETNLDEAIRTIKSSGVTWQDTPDLSLNLVRLLKGDEIFETRIEPESVKAGESYTTYVKFRGRVVNGFFDNYIEQQDGSYRRYNWDRETIPDTSDTAPGLLNGMVDIERSYTWPTDRWPAGTYKIYVRLYSHLEPGETKRVVVHERVHGFEVKRS